MKQLVFLFALVFFVGCFSGESEGTFVITGETTCDENLTFLSTKSFLDDYNLTYKTTEHYFFSFSANENTSNTEHGGYAYINSTKKDYKFSINDSGIITISGDINATVTFWCENGNTKYKYEDSTTIKNLGFEKK